DHKYLNTHAKHDTVRAPKGPRSDRMRGMVNIQFQFVAWAPASTPAAQPLEAVLAEGVAVEMVGPAPRGDLEREASQALQK
ncbi:unnamed protein product, partial [Prorocentrum cordatum]